MEGIVHQENGAEQFSRERLMEEIRQYPCIYDKYDKDYADKTAKNNAWAAIAGKYGITAMEADRKYKTMRSSFTRYLKKKRNTAPGYKSPPLPVAFANLDWLAVHIDHKETALRYTSNGNKDEYYGDYLPDGDDTYHSSYDEIMREESNQNDAINPTTSAKSRQRDGLKTESALSHSLLVRDSSKPDSVSSPQLHAKDKLRPDPIPTPTVHVNTPEYQPSRAATEYQQSRPATEHQPCRAASEYQPSRAVTEYQPNVDITPVSPPIPNRSIQSPNIQTPQTNGTKSITMYYNRPKVNDAQNDTVLNLIPVEPLQPGMSTQTPSASVGKRKRIEYDDEDELFCLSLVPTLKRLGPRNKTIAKMRFQQVLFDLEFPNNE